MTERQAIHAVHTDDHEELLGRLGLLDSFRSGELKCGICEQPVREQGLGLVRMSGSDVEVACAEVSCTKSNRGAE